MLCNVNDLFFSYKNVFRFILINQCFFLVNTNQIPKITNLFFIFKIYNLVDIDDVRSFIMLIFLDFFLVERPLLLRAFLDFL
jgi:hypothetical protein